MRAKQEQHEVYYLIFHQQHSEGHFQEGLEFQYNSAKLTTRKLQMEG